MDMLKQHAPGQVRRHMLQVHAVPLADHYAINDNVSQCPLQEAAVSITRSPPATAAQVATQLAAFEVYSRKGKLLLALSAVQRAAALAGRRHPDVHRAIVRFCLQVRPGSCTTQAIPPMP